MLGMFWSYFSMLMYYFWMVGQANHKMAEALRDQLKIVSTVYCQ